MCVTGESMTFRIRYLELLSLPLKSLLAGLCVLSMTACSDTQRVDLQKEWIRELQTAELHFPAPDSKWAAGTPGRHPRFINYVLNKILKWDPQDQSPVPTGNCSVTKLVRDLMADPRASSKTAVFNRYYNHCEDQYINGVLQPQWQALRLFSMAYSIDEHPFLHRVVINLPDGKKLKGLLALKDNKPRPFVVLRMGIGGNIEEAFPERFFYYQLFERGLFHLLMVENMTSPDFIHNNKSLEFGGMAESYQNIWLAQLLRSDDQPLSRLVQSLHLIGLSLGGQGVLVTSYLAPFQKNPNLFQSYLALCPLVNLKPTFQYLFESGLKRFPVEIWAHNRFQEIEAYKPELFTTYWGLPGRILSELARNYQRPPAELFQVTEPEFIRQSQDFFFLHELSRWDSKNHRPFWIWVTNEDSIVPVALNADTLPDVNAVRIPIGDHCSFPAAWDGRVTQALFRGHILGATDFQFEWKSVVLNADFKKGWNFQGFQPAQGGRLKIELISLENEKTSFEIDLNDLDFHFRRAQLSEAEKRMIRRWLSTNLVFSPSSGGTGMTVSWPFVTSKE